jgi:hypothetical protein
MADLNASMQAIAVKVFHFPTFEKWTERTILDLLIFQHYQKDAIKANSEAEQDQSM